MQNGSICQDFIVNLTQKQVSEKVGMKNVYSYQRLEKKSNPSLQMIKKITSIFPAIKLEMLLSMPAIIFKRLDFLQPDGPKIKLIFPE